MGQAKEKTFKVRVENSIDMQMVKDLLCTALEAGSGYWAKFEDWDLASGVKRSDFEWIHEIPFKEGCALEFTIRPDVDQDDGWYKLDWENMESGLQVMAEKYNWHYANLINDNADAETADVFLQCSLFGEIVYG